MSLTCEYPTAVRNDHGKLDLPVAASTTIFRGALVVTDAGYAKPGSEATGLVAQGIAFSSADNATGLDGAQYVHVRPGEALLVNSAGVDEITIADAGSVCYVVSDRQVAKTDGGATRSVAGVITGIESRPLLSATGTIWVSIGATERRS